jgi:hypothetical protein
MAVKWRTKPIPALGFKWKNLFPLLGLVVAALLQGFTKAMIPLLWGLVICALWAAASLWPFVSNVGSRIVNSPYLGFLDQRFSRDVARANIHQLYLEERRRVFFRCICLNLFAAASALVAAIFGLSACLMQNQHFEAERSEVSQELEMGVPERPSQLPIRPMDAYVRIQNNSPIDLQVQSVWCDINSLGASDNSVISGVKFEMLLRGKLALTIRAAGDGQIMPCIPPAMLHSAEPTTVTCGDVIWKIEYVLADQPNLVQTKQERFILEPGSEEWRQFAVDNPSAIDCPWVAKR